MNIQRRRIMGQFQIIFLSAVLIVTVLANIFYLGNLWQFMLITAFAFVIWLYRRSSGIPEHKNKFSKYGFAVILIACIASFDLKQFIQYLQHIEDLFFDIRNYHIYIESGQNRAIPPKAISFQELAICLVQIFCTVCLLEKFMGPYDDDIYCFYYKIALNIKKIYRYGNLNNDEIKQKRRYRLAKVLAKEYDRHHVTKSPENPVLLVKTIHNLAKSLHRPAKTRNYDDNLILVTGKSGMGKSLALLTLALRFIPFPLKYTDSFKGWKFFTRTMPKIPVYARLSEIKTLKDVLSDDTAFSEGSEKDIWLSKFWHEFFLYALGAESIDKNLEKKLTDLRSSGKLIFLLDGINEVSFLSTGDEIRRFLRILHMAVENNLCVLTTTPVDTDFGTHTGILKSYQISSLDKYSLKKLLKVFHIEEKEIYKKPIVEYPFFLGIIIRLKETYSPSDNVCEKHPYELMEKYISSNLQKADCDMEQEAIKKLSRSVYHSYKENHMVNDRLSGQDEIFKTEAGQDLKRLLLSLKILKIKAGEEISFYHDWYWRFFMALGCKNSGHMEKGGYWTHFVTLSSERGLRADRPDPIKIAKNTDLAPILAMYLSGVPGQLQCFLQDCYQCYHDADYNDQLTLFEYIADHLLSFLPEHKCFTEHGQAFSSQSMLDDFFRKHRDKNDFRIKILWVKVICYCNPETQRQIMEKIFHGESEWLKKNLLSSYALKNDGVCLFQKALEYSFDSCEKNSEFSRQSSMELQVKKYFLTQYISDMYENKTFYKKLFKGMKGNAGRRLYGFIKCRYFDIAMTWVLYIFFLFLFGLNIISLCMNSNFSKAMLVFSAVKVIGFLIFAGSFKAWIEQCRYSGDVYLEIFGRASRWMTIKELIDMLAENRNVCLFKSFFKAAGNGSLGEFLPILSDWVRVRPSVIILLSMMLLLIWPNLVFPSVQWFHCIFAAAAILVMWIPITDYRYLSIAQKHQTDRNRQKEANGRNETRRISEDRACLALMLKSLCLIFSLLAAGAIFTLSCEYLKIKIFITLSFAFTVTVTVFSIGNNAKTKMTADRRILKEIEKKEQQENIADLNLFMKFKTSEGQKQYLRMVCKDFYINGQWLNACRSESVKELFYESGVLYREEP